MCPEDAKSIGHQTCKRKICGCEHEKFKFMSLIVSPGTAVIEWFIIKKLLSLKLYSLQSMMYFDRALYYMATSFSQKMVFLQSGYG